MNDKETYMFVCDYCKRKSKELGENKPYCERCKQILGKLEDRSCTE